MVIKFLVLAAGVVAAFLIWTGAIEVKLNNDKLASAPLAAKQMATDKTLYQQAGIFATKYKREFEQYLVKDDDKKLELALEYVKTDSESLSKLINNKADAKLLAQEAELLSASLEKSKGLMDKVSIDTVANIRDVARGSFTQARSALTAVQDRLAQNKESNGKLEQTVAALEKQVGEIKGFGDAGIVAGTREQK